MKFTAAEEALSLIVQNNHRVFIHGGCATPQAPGRCPCRTACRAAKCRDHAPAHRGHGTVCQPGIMAERFQGQCFFCGQKMCGRLSTKQTCNTYPCSSAKFLFYMRSGKFPVDVALVQVSPPDAHGFCSLGISVDIAKAACDMAHTIVALVNPNMPRSLGDGFIHQSKFAAAVYSENAVYECSNAALTATETRHWPARGCTGRRRRHFTNGHWRHTQRGVVLFRKSQKPGRAHRNVFGWHIALGNVLASSTAQQKQNIPAKSFLLLPWAPESSTTLYTIIRRWPCWMWRM
jgi:hypothetical protein